jgi:hypothetical protein
MASNKNNGKKTGERKEKVLKIKHEYPNGAQSIFVNHMIVQHNPQGEFQISFFEINQPAFLGTPEEVLVELNKLDSVPAQCVSRIIVTKERLPGFIAALVENLHNFQQATAEQPSKKTNGQKHAS